MEYGHHEATTSIKEDIERGAKTLSVKATSHGTICIDSMQRVCPGQAGIAHV
jgi:hypothetical protein